MAIEGMGKAKYGKSGFAKRFKVVTPKGSETSSNIYRIMPPMKSLAESGKWRQYHGTHFGYKMRTKNDPTKTMFATFECVQEKDFRTGMVHQECAECTVIAERKAEKTEREAAYKKQGLGKDEIKNLLAPLNTYLQSHNCDRKYHMNVMNDAGEFGSLPIGSKMNKALDLKIKELIEVFGIDPIDPDEGVWFNFKRTGQALEIVDSVEVVKIYTKDPETKRVTEEIKPGRLTADQCSEALRVCEDLTTLVTRITPEQVQQLVDCSGDPDEVEAIFGVSAERSPAREAPAKTEPEVRIPPKAALKAAPKPAPEPTVPEAAPEESEEEDEIAAMEAAIAAKRAAKLAASKTEKLAPAAAYAKTVDVPAPEMEAAIDFSSQSDEDFMAQFS